LHVSRSNVGIVILIGVLSGNAEHGSAAGGFTGPGAFFRKLNLCLGKPDYDFSGGVQQRIIYWGCGQRKIGVQSTQNCGWLNDCLCRIASFQ